MQTNLLSPAASLPDILWKKHLKREGARQFQRFDWDDDWELSALSDISFERLQTLIRRSRIEVWEVTRFVGLTGASFREKLPKSRFIADFADAWFGLCFFYRHRHKTKLALFNDSDSEAVRVSNFLASFRSSIVAPEEVRELPPEAVYWGGYEIFPVGMQVVVVKKHFEFVAKA